MIALALKKESDNYWNLIKDAEEINKAIRDARHVKSSRDEYMILVTENVKDFQYIKGIRIENWIVRD